MSSLRRQLANKKYHHGDLKNALIKAGIEIHFEEAGKGLNLRKVAQRARGSHAAPYAHFSEMQALIAAILTEGYKALYGRITYAVEQYPDDPLQQLVEGA